MAEYLLTPVKYKKMKGEQRRENIRLWKSYGWRNKELMVIMPFLQNFTVRTSGVVEKTTEPCNLSLTYEQIVRLYRCVESKHTGAYICANVEITDHELLMCGEVYALFFSLVRQGVSSQQLRTMLTMGIHGGTANAMYTSSNTSFYIAQQVREKIIDAGVIKFPRE